MGKKSKKRKYEVLSHYTIMEKHIVEMTEAEAESDEAEYIAAERSGTENLISSKSRDYEIVDISEMRS